MLTFLKIKFFSKSFVCFYNFDIIFNNLANMLSTMHFHNCYDFFIIAFKHSNLFNENIIRKFFIIDDEN